VEHNALGRRLDEALLKRLRANAEVELAQPVINKKAILQSDTSEGKQEVLVDLIGADKLGPGTLYPDIGDLITKKPIPIPDDYILVGRPIHYALGLQQGCRVLVVSTSPMATALGPRLRQRWATVYAMNGFSTRMPDFFDAKTAFVSVNEIRDFYHMAPGTADYIHVKLKNPFEADHFKRELDLNPKQYKVTTWNEENSDFFGALKLERLGLWLILMLIILVAALNIVGTLILMVIEKTREVGILRAIGASERLVGRIFLVDGMMIGLIGTLIGVVIGISVCLFIPTIKIDLPAAVIFNNLPVKIKPLTVGLVVIASMAICTLAGLFPARQAAKLNPVEALRYD
jgi:lipoprotein-releasing system permease protein